MKYLVVAAAMTASIMTASAQQRSYYDSHGSFAGSSIYHEKNGTSGAGTTSHYDRNGSFAGSSIRNSDHTISHYDRSGHFSGSESRPYR
jgi:hypothetical protein